MYNKKRKKILLSFLLAATITSSLLLSTAFAAKLSGDINNDGAVNVVDATMLNRYIIKKDISISVSDGDLNADGRVNSIDYLLLKKMLKDSLNADTKILPEVTSVDKDGPFSVAIDQNVGPQGIGWVVRPASLQSLGVKKHPIFLFGAGGGSKPSDYQPLLKRLASHGFVVYSETPTSSGTEMKAALDWIAAQNTNASSPYYNKLDTNRIGAGGHSLGNIGAYLVTTDPRVITTVHCDGGSFDGLGTSKMTHPTAMICGENDNLALDNHKRDYQNCKVPVWFGLIKGGGHGAGPWDGTPAIVAWLRWQLAGETDRKSMFIGSGATFNTGMWISQYKNW